MIAEAGTILVLANVDIITGLIIIGRLEKFTIPNVHVTAARSFHEYAKDIFGPDVSIRIEVV